MPGSGVEEGRRQPSCRTAEREHGVSNQGARARAQSGGANLGPGGGAVAVDELGPGLNRLGAEVVDGSKATADAVAALDDGDRETAACELTRGGYSSHPGADDEDIGSVGSFLTARRVTRQSSHVGSVTEVSHCGEIAWVENGNENQSRPC